MRAFTQGFATALCSVAVIVSGVLQAAETPEFLLSSPTLQPETTFEVRYPQHVVQPEAVGQAKPNPGTFKPGVDGEWRWSSQRSAIFTPSEPLPLDTEFRVTIPPRELGDTVTRGIIATFSTPEFGVVATYPQLAEDKAIAPMPRIQLLLNGRIDPRKWQDKLTFVNDKGTRIPAHVFPTTPEEYFPSHLGPDRQLEPWSDRFYLARDQKPPEAKGSYRIAIRPVEPLASGRSWQLDIPAGLPGLGRLSTQAQRFAIGFVRPLEVEEVTATSTFGDGRSIDIRFTKPIHDNGIDSKDYVHLLTLDPPVPNLSVNAYYNGLRLSGDFAPETDYRIALPANLSASDETPFSGNSVVEVRMPMMERRLALTEFDAPQLAGGRRVMEMLSVNNHEVRVQVKRLSADDLAAVLTPYGNRNIGNDQYWESQSEGRIDFDAMPGELVYDETLDLSAELDELVAHSFSVDQFLGEDPTGVILFQAEALDQPPLVGVQSINQITDLGLVWKRGTTEWLAFVHSLETGEPMAGVEVRMVDAEGKALSEGVTAKDGTLSLDRPEDHTWLILEKGQDLLATRVDANRVNVPRYAYDLSLRYDDPRDSDYSILLFTDRGVYQPGDSLNLRGIVRQWRDGLLQLPRATQGELTVYDPKGRTVRTEEINLDQDGSFASTFELPETPTGFYRAHVMIAGVSGDEEELYFEEEEASGAVTFQVQDYEPAAFEVALRAAPPAAGAQTLDVTLGATYQTGEPLAGAVAHWTADLRSNYTRPLMRGFKFGISSYEARQYLDIPAPTLEQDGETTLNDSGQTVIQLPIQGLRDHIVPLRIEVSAEVIDDSQQTITTAATYPINPRAETLGIRFLREQPVADEPASFQVILTDESGEPQSRTLEGSWRLLKINRTSIREETAGGGHRYVTEITTEPAGNGSFATVPMEKTFGQWALATDEPSITVTPVNAGEYLLVVEGKDREGTAITTAYEFDVAGEGREKPQWAQTEPYYIELAADRADYVVGDTAHILVKTPIAGTALVTVERENVQQHFVQPLTDEAPLVAVPLTDADTPNTFVSVTIVRGADASPDAWPVPEYRLGYTELIVRDPTRELRTALEMSRKEYEPRETVRTTVKVADEADQPVADANVTLYAVDEGVLALTAYRTPDPLRFFYRFRPLFVQTGLTIPQLREENPDAIAYWNKGYIIGGGGMELDPAQLRTNFAAVAYWSTSLRTDANGEATAEFIAPDSLTRYRVMAVVQEGPNRFGATDTHFKVRKPFMIKPSLPRLAREGDRLNARALLQNTLPEAGSAEVRLQVEGPAEIEGPATVAGIEIASHSAATVDIPVVITGTGEITWTWQSTLTTTGGIVAQDGMRDSTESRRVTPLVRSIQNPELTPGDTTPLLASVDPSLLEASGIEVQVALSNSRLIELREGVENLLHYPYGCIEQTTSSMLPWLVVGPLREILPDFDLDDTAIETAVKKGLARIWSMQTRDGGLGYWPDSEESMLWGSAYAGLVVALAHEKGWQPETEEFARYLEYLRTALHNAGETEKVETLAAQTMATYALASLGKPEASYHEVLFNRRDKLGPDSRRFLALAILKSGGPREMAQTLIDEPLLADWKRLWFSSVSRLRALDLLCRIELGAPREELEQSYARLLDLRRNGAWQTTQGNAWALLAALAFDASDPRADEPVEATLVWEGAEHPLRIGGDQAPTLVKQFTGGALRPDSLQIRLPDGRKLYPEIRLAAELDTPAQTLAKNDGFAVSRSYTRITPDGKVAEDQRLQAGDRVLVTLTVTTSEPSEYVALADPLPALLEAVNPRFATQAAGSQPAAGRQSYAFHSFRELREDQALFFADYLQPGRHVVRYVARVRHTGRATAPAAQVERMYDPDFRGRSAPMVLTANEASR